MSRPIWKGSISFGLVNIPVTLYSAEKRSDLHFHMLDSRNNARIRYERINETTGKHVPWDDIVKAYEYDKDNYVVMDESAFEKTASEHPQTVDIEDFVDAKELDPIYYDKPYYLVPSKTGEKAYALLRDILIKKKKIGISKVLIRTRQYLAALRPYKHGIMLDLLRYPQEIRDLSELEIPKVSSKSYKIKPKEVEMAEKLVEAMSAKWDPKRYHDENREVIEDWIQKKIHKGKGVAAPSPKEEKTVGERKGKVIDFMSLLKKSIEEKEKNKGKKKSSRTLKNDTKKSPKKKDHKERGGHKKHSSKGK